MKGMIVPNVELIDRYRMGLVLSWSELMGKAGLSGKIATRMCAGQGLSPRTIRKLAVALDVEPSRLVVVPSARRGKAASMAACA